MSPIIRNLNQAIESFDARTGYKYDRETDLDTVARLAAEHGMTDVVSGIRCYQLGTLALICESVHAFGLAPYDEPEEPGPTPQELADTDRVNLHLEDQGHTDL